MARRPLVLLSAAAACAAAAVLVWLAAFVAGAGSRLDAAVLDTFTDLAAPPIQPRIHGVAVLANPGPFLLLALLVTGVALARRRILMAAMVPVILVAANVTTQVLKPGLADPRLIELAGADQAYPASWPSGHATAAMSLALCAILVAGPRLRPLAAMLGAAYAVAVGYALVALGWHLPSDVLGGYLVAAAYALLGAAAVAALEGRTGTQAAVDAPGGSEWTQTPAGAGRARPGPSAATGRRASRALVVPPLLGALAVVTLAGLALALRAPDALSLSARDGVALVAGAGIAALAVALTVGLALALRR